MDNILSCCTLYVLCLFNTLKTQKRWFTNFHCYYWSTCGFVQDGFTHFGKQIYDLHPISQVPHSYLSNSSNVGLTDGGPFLTFQGSLHSVSSAYSSLLQVINGVMCSALCKHLVSQGPQHFRSSKMHATCVGYLYLPVYLLGHSLYLGMPRTLVHPQESSNRDAGHCQSGLPVSFPFLWPGQ